ncbi:Kinesin-like protein KIF27, partial [Tetrabaena socialis]
MADDEPSSSIQVCVRAVDKNTLLQLRGATAKGYAFDRRYGQDVTSDAIYDDCVASLGYNATVLAYGQTGSGKTHTMAGGAGIHGVVEEGKPQQLGVTPRVIQHIFALAEAIRKKEKPGERTV